MKILCVIDSLGQGGAQRQLVELATGFKEKGHHVSFLTYHHIPFFNDVVEKAGILITCIEEKNYLRRLFRMRRFIRRGGYDAVLSFLERASFICEFAGLPRRRWRLVVGERNAGAEVKRKPVMRFFLLFHLFADYVVANSAANIRIIRSLNPLLRADRCRVIYNIVDFDRWKPDLNGTPRNGSPLRILVAARVDHQKNLKGLTDALALMDPEELERIRIDWYGRMPEEEKLDPSTREALAAIRANGLGKVVRFYPPAPDIEKQVSQADAVGLFSLYEGFPNSIIEGMAMGKPAFCSAVSDVPELLSHEPELLFDPEDPRSIARALRHLVGMDPDRLALIGRENGRIARKWFHRENIINEYLELLGA
ncbi:MAG TPA: glycosyltransferase [Bacteroides sp.]|nr:glycosyltransferase [Bacteroides sp.]